MTALPARKGAGSAARLTEMADYVVPFTLRAACDLRIADHLAEGPLTIEELARRTCTHAPSLYRAMRVLACKGVFTETEPAVFAMTPLAEPLRGDHPFSLRDAYPLMIPDVRAWAMLEHTLRTGEPAFEAAHGKTTWEYFAGHPEENARFNASQRAVTHREVRSLVPALGWASYGTVVDIGGGTGAFIAALLAAHPDLKGTLYDQPHVVAEAGALLAESGVEDRCTVIGGDYRESVPAGGGAYVFKRVFYDMDDDRATRVLRHVRAAMRPDGRVLIIEPVVEPGDAFDWGKLYDLLLLIMSGGGGRTREHIEEILADAGFELERIIPTRSLPIVEARPR